MKIEIIPTSRSWGSVFQSEAVSQLLHQHPSSQLWCKPARKGSHTSGMVGCPLFGEEMLCGVDSSAALQL